MNAGRHLALVLFALLLPVAASAQYPVRDGTVANMQPYVFAAADFGIDASSVTYSKDIAPLLQRSCESCHRAGGGAPMSLMNYQEVRRYAERIKDRTALRDRMGAMPPFYVEPGFGIQHFKNDPSLSDAELATIQAWADNGAPEGDPSDLPPPLEWPTDRGWALGEPDLIVRGPDMTMPAVGPDRWGDIGLVPTGLTQNRYVKSVEVRESNDIPTDAEATTVGGRYIFHHMTYSSGVLNEAGDGLERGTSQSWPIHEVGRNADEFMEGVGMLLQAGSALSLSASHLHSTGWRETTGRLDFGFTFYPEDYEPRYRQGLTAGGDGINQDVRPDLGGQEFHSYRVLQSHTMLTAFEPHLHAPGVRMCLEAIWGITRLTLNCVGYDHNWVKQYVYEDGYAPLLPKGTILHTIGWVDTTPENPNTAETRNWAGAGRRSVASMFIDLGQSVRLTEEQFQAEMAKRRARMSDPNEYDIGCPLCWAPDFLPVSEEQDRQGGGA
jgi:hypothetical protein